MTRGTGARLAGAGVLALTLLVVVAEVVVGNVIHDRIAHAIEARTDSQVSVDLGSRPALIDLAAGDIPQLKLSAGDVCGLEGVSVAAALDGVGIGSPVGYEASAVTVAASTGAIEALLSRSPQAAKLERLGAEVVAEPSAEELLLRAGPGGLLEVPLRPVLSGDTLSLEPGTPTVMGRPLPAAATGRLGKIAPKPRSLDHLPLGLHPDDVRVTAEGVEFDLRGGAGTIDRGAAERTAARVCTRSLSPPQDARGERGGGANSRKA